MKKPLYCLCIQNMIFAPFINATQSVNCPPGPTKNQTLFDKKNPTQNSNRKTLAILNQQRLGQ